MRDHWKAVASFAAVAALVFAGAISVFLWFAGNAESSGLVPSTLGTWTMGNLVTFILYSVFWEILFIGPPTAVVALAAWQWWKRLPGHGRNGYPFNGNSRSTNRGSGLSLLFFIAFCVKVYLDGKWNVALGAFTVDYVVGSAITIIIWGLAIFGIPAAIALTWWVTREMRKA